MVDFHNISRCPPAKLPADPQDVNAILTVLVEAERCAVYQYTHICNMTAGKDHRTYNLALSILNEEIEHESWFSTKRPFPPAGRDLSARLQVPAVERRFTLFFGNVFYPAREDHHSINA